MDRGFGTISKGETPISQMQEAMKGMVADKKEEVEIPKKETIQPEIKTIKTEEETKMTTVSTIKEQTDIIELTLNIKTKQIEEFMTNDIKVPFAVSLKQFNPKAVVDNTPENEKAEVAAIVKRIVGFSDDETYNTVVPVLTIDSAYLKKPVMDPNLTVIGRPVEKSTLDNVKSKYVVPHIVDRTRFSEVYLDTATLIVNIVCDKIASLISKEEILMANSAYEMAFIYNGADGYTVTIRNKYFKEVKR